MGAFKFVWVIGLIYSTLLLTISFFVLFVVRKIDSKNLRFFGYAVALLLWLCAAFVFFSGIYLSTKSFVRAIPCIRPGLGGNQVPGQIPLPQGARPRQ